MTSTLLLTSVLTDSEVEVVVAVVPFSCKDTKGSSVDVTFANCFWYEPTLPANASNANREKSSPASIKRNKAIYRTTLKTLLNVSNSRAQLFVPSEFSGMLWN